MSGTIPIVVVGAGGFGRETHDVIEALNDSLAEPRYEFLGFLADYLDRPELIADRGPLLGDLNFLAKLPVGTQYVIGIADAAARRRIDEQATLLGLTAATLVHPTVTMSRYDVELGPGTILCSHVSLTTTIVLGRHVHVNLNATIGHDVTIHDYVTINPGATISGNVVLEGEVTIGTGASVIQKVTIGTGSTIGAGAAVVRDIPAGVTAVGIPAKILRPAVV
jgi:sugar O-acyltransferase (sialic acid O-acetyltransferase NeuD family)